VLAFAVAASFAALSAGTLHGGPDSSGRAGTTDQPGLVSLRPPPLPPAAVASTSATSTTSTTSITNAGTAALRAPATPSSIGAAALQLIDYPWDRFGFSLTFDDAASGLLAKTDCNTKAIVVYVRSAQTVRQVAFVTAFEIAHAVDCSTMTDQRRAEWASLRGFPTPWTWFPGCLCPEDDFGSGDFAQVFAAWLVPDAGYRWRSGLAGPPGPQTAKLMPYLRPSPPD